jgi:hypothetical protein
MARRASLILRLAVATGVLLIVGSAALRVMRERAFQRGCAAGAVPDCVSACRRHDAAACATLERRCIAGEAYACQGRDYARAHPKRWP